MAKKKKAQAPPPAPQPQGKAQKRTPTSAFDPAAGNDVYEPEKIIGQRSRSTRTESRERGRAADGWLLSGWYLRVGAS